MAKSQPVSTKTLEKKFARTAFRLSQERNDFLLPQIVDLVRKEKWINLRPEYQRRLVWDRGKRSRFVESLLLNVPIPPIFIYEWDLNRYEVMDGQQRLNAIVDYYENGFALTGLEYWNELEGLRYRDLPDTLQRGLDRRRISATVLLVEGGARDPGKQNDVRKLVFDRLNTGGQQLKAQELRNCVYAGPFNDMLIRLSRRRLFALKWAIPPYEDNVDAEGQVSTQLANNQLYRRMTDVEIVLRFFAFRRKAKIKGAVKSILDTCMEDHLDDKDADLTRLESIFDQRLELADAIFGEHTFRYEDAEGKPTLSRALYDGVMVGLDRLWKERRSLVAHKIKIGHAIDRLMADEGQHSVIVGNPNTAKAIIQRIELITNAMSSASGI